MILAIDAGGTNLRAKIYQNAQEIKSYSAKSKESDFGAWIEDILKNNPEIKTVCISYAGQVSNSRIIDSPNIKIDKLDLKEYFEINYKIKLFIENDLKCAVLAESKEHKSKNICALYVGTGIGLGVIENERLIKGSGNFATEIGHIPFSPAPFQCGCGRENCLELFASGSGLEKWIKYYNLNCDVSLVTLKNKIDPNAKKILDQFEKALLYAAGCVITLFNPEILVLGGGIMESNPYLLDLVRSNINQYALKTSLKSVRIIQSNLSEAPLVGAILLKDSYV